jgi:beta-glucanase (GH16 family)
MLHIIRWSCSVLALGVGVALASWGVDAAAEPPSPGWKLAWSDEFDGKELDPARWDFDIGNGSGGWGNAELQYYTREPRNVFVKDGLLHIRALKESLQGFGYTSARLKTRKKDGGPLFNQRYGWFEFRVKLPTGRGVWPALWMMPQEDKYGGWAASGEIDIMEARGQEPHKVLGTLHYGSRWPGNVHTSREYVLPGGGTIADFHVYALEWLPGEMRWFVDGRQYAAQSFWWSSSRAEGRKGVKPTKEADLNPWPAPFDRPFYLIMNVAVGGRFLGPPDQTTVFPAEMVLDYVRVYDKVGGYGDVKPRGAGAIPFGKP